MAHYNKQDVLLLGVPVNKFNEPVITRLLGSLSSTAHDQAARVTGLNNAMLGEAIQVTLGATDADPATEAAGFSYLVDWGDGEVRDLGAVSGTSIQSHWPSGQRKETFPPRRASRC